MPHYRWTITTLGTTSLLGILFTTPGTDPAAAAQPAQASKTREQRDCADHKAVCLTVTHRIYRGSAHRRDVEWVDVRRYKGFHKSRVYKARWLYKRPGGKLHHTRWNIAENYRGTAIETWDYDGLNLGKHARVCGQFKDSSAKACVTLR
ncbi:hypothetical protein [Bacillus cereus]|uniref:hypothetical protein n=1 Tax=Bacillus cereus TaxID=1396 RepID=UPI0036720E1F